MSEKEVPKEEKEETQQFLTKIKVLSFVDYKDYIEQAFDGIDFSKMSLCDSAEQSLTVLSIEATTSLFVNTILKIQEQRAAEIGSMVFDKDDVFAMDFVSAATNIRAHNFSIPNESSFKIKEMAGKIVPAISSSNALVAALQVHEAIKLLAGE